MGHRISEAAEKWIDFPIRVLDHGYVTLVDYMGNDTRIAEAARQSTTGESKGENADRALIRYMLDCSHPPHTSPFEMVETVWKVHLPIFVARQWVRHRTASLNEYSGRYSVIADEAYIPNEQRIRNGAQDTVNRQGSTKSNIDERRITQIQREMKVAQSEAFEDYHYWLDSDGLAKELARVNLPLSSYTTWMWKIDLHNLFHFLYLRLDGHAQHEIRVYADRIWEVVQDIVPYASEAFRDFRLEAVTLSRMQKEELIELAKATGMDGIILASKVMEYLHGIS